MIKLMWPPRTSYRKHWVAQIEFSYFSFFLFIFYLFFIYFFGSLHERTDEVMQMQNECLVFAQFKKKKLVK